MGWNPSTGEWEEEDDFWANTPAQASPQADPAPQSVPLGGYSTPSTASGPVGSVTNPDMSMVLRDQNSWEGTLKSIGGDLYDPSDLSGVIRNVSYARNAGMDPATFIEQQRGIYDARRNNVPGGNPQSDESVPLRAMNGTNAGGMWGGFTTGAPNYMQPFTDQFSDPTMTDLQNSPGYLGRLDAGKRLIQNSAAAKGTLLTGGTLKGLETFGQDLASNEYDKLWQEAMAKYNTKFNVWNTNEQNRFGSQQTNRLTDFNIFDSGRNFDRTLSNDQWGRGMDTFSANRATNNDFLDNQYRLSALGAPKQLGG